MRGKAIASGRTKGSSSDSVFLLSSYSQPSSQFFDSKAHAHILKAVPKFVEASSCREAICEEREEMLRVVDRDLFMAS